MRPLAVWALLPALALAVVTGCDSDQPLLAPARNAELSFVASGAFTTYYEIYEMFEDTVGLECVTGATTPQGDGVPDYGVVPWCDAQGFRAPTSVPWPFDLTVRVVRAGETEATTLLSTSTRAPYDPSVSIGIGVPDGTVGGAIVLQHERGVCSGNPARVCNPADGDSLFCQELNEGTCLEATGFCSQDSSLYCRENANCSAVGAGNCIDDPTGACSANSCLRCDPDAMPGDDGFAVCADAGAGSCIPDSACDGGVPCLVRRVFKWNNGFFERTAANRVYLEEIAGSFPFLFDQDPNRATLLDQDPGHPDTGEPRNGGRCPIVQAEQPDTFEPLPLQLDPGDTILVEARLGNSGPTTVNFDPTQMVPNLGATFSVDGQNVDVVGSDVQSGTSSAGSIDFHFTAQ